MSQHTIRLVGGPNNGSRIKMPPADMLGEGRIVKLRGTPYELVFDESIGRLPQWEAHYVEPHGELDPEPWYVAEADEQDLGPESAAGRYSMKDWNESARVAPYGGPVYNLAKWHPRKQYEQDRKHYR